MQFAPKSMQNVRVSALDYMQTNLGAGYRASLSAVTYVLFCFVLFCFVLFPPESIQN